jgi:hypothetical protein
MGYKCKAQSLNPRNPKIHASSPIFKIQTLPLSYSKFKPYIPIPWKAHVSLSPEISIDQNPHSCRPCNLRYLYTTPNRLIPNVFFLFSRREKWIVARKTMRRVEEWESQKEGLQIVVLIAVIQELGFHCLRPWFNFWFSLYSELTTKKLSWFDSQNQIDVSFYCC